MSKKVLVHLSFQRDIFDAVNDLRSKGLRDGELHYFKFAMATKNSWYNYVMQMGVNKVREDFEKWKKMQDKEKDEP